MSMSRRCDVIKATDSKWYLILGNFEHAEMDQDCTVYGPFNSQEAVNEELDNHSNPGSMWIDDSGTCKPPASPVAPTSSSNNFMWRPTRRW